MCLDANGTPLMRQKITQDDSLLPPKLFANAFWMTDRRNYYYQKIYRLKDKLFITVAFNDNFNFQRSTGNESTHEFLELRHNTCMRYHAFFLNQVFCFYLTMFSLTSYHFSGCLSFRRFHWVMQGLPKLFSLSPFLLSLPSDFRLHRLQRKSN